MEQQQEPLPADQRPDLNETKAAEFDDTTAAYYAAFCDTPPRSPPRSHVRAEPHCSPQQKLRGVSAGRQQDTAAFHAAAAAAAWEEEGDLQALLAGSEAAAGTAG